MTQQHIPVLLCKLSHYIQHSSNFISLRTLNPGIVYMWLIRFQISFHQTIIVGSIFLLNWLTFCIRVFGEATLCYFGDSREIVFGESRIHICEVQVSILFAIFEMYIACTFLKPQILQFIGILNYLAKPPFSSLMPKLSINLLNRQQLEAVTICHNSVE